MPTGSCDLPENLARAALKRSPRPADWPSWSCSGWGLPSRPSHLGRWWSLTPPFHPYLPREAGGLFSVALSRGSPRVGVTHHPALRSPDFPQPGSPGRDHPADSSLGILAAHRGESPALLKIDAASGSSTVTPVSSELPSPYRDHRRDLTSRPGITARSLRCEPGSGRIPRISAPHLAGPCGRRQDPKL